MGGGASKPPPGGVTPQDNVIVQRLEKLEVAVKGRDDAQAAAQAAKDAEIAALKQVAELTNALALAKSPQKTYSSASATRVSSGDGALSALAAEVEELREQLSEAHEKIEEETFAHEQTRAASRQHVQVPASVWCLVFRAPSAPRCRAYPAYPLPAAGPASARASSVRASVTPGWRTAQSVEEDVQKLQQQLEEATEALSDEKFAHEQTKKAALTQVEMLTEELGKPGSAAAGGGEASETSFHAIVLDLRGKLADALEANSKLEAEFTAAVSKLSSVGGSTDKSGGDPNLRETAYAGALDQMQSQMRDALQANLSLEDELKKLAGKDKALKPAAEAAEGQASQAGTDPKAGNDQPAESLPAPNEPKAETPAPEATAASAPAADPGAAAPAEPKAETPAPESAAASVPAADSGAAANAEPKAETPAPEAAAASVPAADSGAAAPADPKAETPAPEATAASAPAADSGAAAPADPKAETPAPEATAASAPAADSSAIEPTAQPA